MAHWYPDDNSKPAEPFVSNAYDWTDEPLTLKEKLGCMGIALILGSIGCAVAWVIYAGTH